MQKQINIKVDSKYISEQSNPEYLNYVFLYDVFIKNNLMEAVRLISRYWKITDGVGRVEEVRGSGVVGKTPTIEAGKSFNYVSFCPLNTPIGFMEGHYVMIDQKGMKFNVPIERFNLIAPETLN